MTVSIIIAVKTWQEHLEECVNRCLELDYPDFEIIILPDSDIGTVPAVAKILSTKGTVPEIKVIPTGPVSPANKRDIALKHAQGDILAFIDDDAYPPQEWLKNAIQNFRDPLVAAVGGPAITPKNDGLMQKASGMIYASVLVSGKYVYRYLPRKRREVDDYPSCNFLVRKSIMQDLGGFKTKFWPGEDTKLSLEITKRLGKQIIYDPEVFVWHHRRPLFIAHLKQIANYALHRGYFVKIYPETSLRLPYFIPSIFILGIISGLILLIALPILRSTYFILLAFYLFLVFVFSIPKDFKMIPLIFIGIIFTHLTYGIFFLKGLFSKKLKEEK